MRTQRALCLAILGGLDAPTGGEARWRDHDLIGADDAELTGYRREHAGFALLGGHAKVCGAAPGH